MQTENAFVMFEGTRRASEFLQTFVEFPPSQIPASFTIDQTEDAVKRKVQAAMEKQQQQPQQPQKK